MDYKNKVPKITTMCNHQQHSLWLIHSFTPTHITWYIIIRKLRGTFVTMGRTRAFGRNRRTKLQAKTAVFDAKKADYSKKRTEVEIKEQ